MKQLASNFFRWFMGDFKSAGPMKRRMGQLFLNCFPGQITCTEFERFLVDFYEENLSEREQQVFEFHMSICPMCNVHFRSYVRAIELGKKVCEGDKNDIAQNVPEELVQAILQARSAI